MINATAFDAYTGPAREITVDPSRGIIALHNGSTPGGAQFKVDALSTVGAFTPQGRLSLVSGVAVPTSDVVAATTIYYVPCIGTRVPVWDGAQMALRDINAGLSVALSATYQVALNQIDWFVFMDGSTLRLGHGPNWIAGTVAGSQFARGTGAGSTDLELKNGILTNKNSIVLRFGPSAGNTVTVPANQATYVGSSGNDGTAGTITDSRKLRLLFNAYNQVERPVALPGSGATWTYGTAAFRVLNNDNTQYVGIFNGLPTYIDLSASVDVVNSSATISAYTLALGLDSTTVVPPAASNGLYSSWSGVVATLSATYKDTPSIGMHRFYPLENAASGVAAMWRYFSGYGVRGSVMI
ncbi:hypothetical protein G6M70_20225 [Agrobacterium tumefaciens]|uniref:hypothetical protein n=1 Tax=Agrobacterium tumefaciens TaxID=358 RepID=UPI0015716A19|nr:hypothetical protein [Agrobacterium tumefaciens]NSY99700.1 hypothetical protein [Agrobacterium tumefaciens]NSZ40656.1 hypothetical protein [Agrobacterium tumefaciens]NTB22460.1 hypothetical protein [Agrobacterium tumefaciens]NTB27389.1 hypothetical protein [Agrobacterium tumefaciens]NTB36060.1 hypothetical protein [Agrobacterium tumefaciens]